MKNLKLLGGVNIVTSRFAFRCEWRWESKTETDKCASERAAGVELALRLDLFSALGPLRLELGVGNLRILNGVDVMNEGIVA